MNSLSFPRFARFHDARCHERPGEVERILLDESATGGALTLSHSQFALDVGPPLHLHPRRDEWFLIERGEFAVCLGAHETTLGPGDFAFVPRGMRHAFTCCNEDGALWIGGIGGQFDNHLARLAAASAPLIVRHLEHETSRLRVVVAPELTRTRFGALECHLASLGEVAPCASENADCAFLILEGRVECQLGEARVVAEAGDVLWAPRGVAHGFRVISPTPARWLALSVP